MNRIILIGRITADPELKYAGTENTPLCKFCLAVDRRFKNAKGERETDFIYCAAWKKQAELIVQYVRKGQRLAVEGTLQQERWLTKDGEKKSNYGVQVDNFAFIESASKPASDTHQAPTPDENAAPGSDDLPF